MAVLVPGVGGRRVIAMLIRCCPTGHPTVWLKSHEFAIMALKENTKRGKKASFLSIRILLPKYCVPLVRQKRRFAELVGQTLIDS